MPVELTLTAPVIILVKVCNGLAEINEHHSTTGTFDQHVVGVDVAVRNANLVAVVNGQDELAKDVLGRAFTHTPVAVKNELRQVQVWVLRNLQRQNQKFIIELTYAQ